MNIYLIRHGRQNSSACNVDVPLSEEGRKQAGLLGRRMKDYPLDALYCSDLIRAKETAEIAFSDRKGLYDNLCVRHGLAEIDFGSLTGIPDSDVKSFYKEYYIKQHDDFVRRKNSEEKPLGGVNEFTGSFFSAHDEMVYPEGEGGKEVMWRVMPILHEWIEGESENIAVVTHGGLIRILLSALFGGDFAKRLMFGKSLENCSITQLFFDRKLHGFYLERFNDYAHIESEPELMRSMFVKPNGETN